MGLVVFSSLAARIAGDLPELGPALFAYTSPADSKLLDGSSGEVARFRVVEPIEPADELPDDLVDAFLAASAPSFYEARAQATTPLLEAVRHGARGDAPTASRLSTELARLLLSDEAPGIRRRVREEILASRLDAEATTAERVRAWLEWAPLCRAHRGLVRAAGCLGVPVEQWGPGSVATVAAAGAGWLDLADDPGLLVARRDAIVDLLVVRGDLDPEAAAALAPPRRGAIPTGAQAWQEAALAEARATARRVEPAPVVVTTWLDSALQKVAGERFGEHPWAGVLVETGGVAALGGDALAPGGALALAGRAARMAGGVQAEPRFVRRVDVPGRRALWPTVQETTATLDPFERYARIAALPEQGSVRLWLEGDCAAALHPRLVFAACGVDEPPVRELVALLSELPSASFPLPDDAFVDDQGRLGRRSESARPTPERQ